MEASGLRSNGAFTGCHGVGGGRARPLWIIAGWILAGLAVLPWDRAISRFTEGQGVPGDIRALFGRSEVFGHGYGVLGIAITIYVLDPARRRHGLYYATTFAAAGLSANLLKLQVWRTRPRYFDLDSDTSSFVGSIWTDFQLDYHILRNPENQSFPSAHTAGAVAAAYALSRIYPAGSRWFYTLAVLCAANRIDGNSHFTSDVFWGVALGYGVAAAVAHIPYFRKLLAEPSTNDDHTAYDYTRQAGDGGSVSLRGATARKFRIVHGEDRAKAA
jgi:membrane-associated phospholipid phosphatase